MTDAAVSVRNAERAIARHEGDLHALIRPLSAASAGDGPLSGMTVTVKDIIDVAGVPTTDGAAFPPRLPDRDATVVARLRAAGAVVTGKANLHEFAYGGTTLNPHFGACRNPWDMDRIAGGSSGGSAVAVAAGYCDLSLGSDTAGSGRMPAALTGISALRPTLGRIPNTGVTPCSPFFDTVSPMGRSVETIARAFAVIAGFDPADPLSVDRPVASEARPETLHGIRIGLPTNAFFADETDAAVLGQVAAAAEVLREMGADLVPLTIPGIEGAAPRLEAQFHTDAAMVHSDRLAQSPETFGADIRERLETLGGAVRGVDYARARLWTAEWRRALAPVLGSVDAVLHAACPTIAPRIEDCRATTTATRRLARFCYPWSLAGVPSLAMPCGLADHDLPCGVMLVGRDWSEPRLMAIGQAYQHATDWHRMTPKGLGE